MGVTWAWDLAYCNVGMGLEILDHGMVLGVLNMDIGKTPMPHYSDWKDECYN